MKERQKSFTMTCDVRSQPFLSCPREHESGGSLVPIFHTWTVWFSVSECFVKVGPRFVSILITN